MLLRSGIKIPREFLRIVSNFTKPGQNSPDHPHHGPNGNESLLVSTTTTNAAGSMPYHAWSLPNLQNALPILTAHHEEDSKLIERRVSDPLLDFYVDKQKMEEAAKNIKAIDNRVGLNVIKELKVEEETKAIAEKVQVVEKETAVTPEPVKVKEEVQAKKVLETIKEEATVHPLI